MPDILAELAEVQQARKPAPQHPQGWEPGVAWDGRQGTITSRPIAEPGPDWRNLLLTWGFDPETVEVVEPVQVRTWDAAIGNGETRTMWYYRAGLRAKRAGAASIDELLRLVRSKKARVPQGVEHGSSFVLPFSDWQLGKRGTPAAVERIVAGIDAHAKRLDTLKRLGRRISTVVLPGLGDLGESCDGHYAMQSFEVELDSREQTRLGRRLLLYAIDTFRTRADRVICPAVGGNHGEKRKDGKAFTSFGDNTDVEIYEQVAEATELNPGAYGHVAYVIPQQTLTLTLDVSGVIVGMAHGHQARSGGTTAQQKVATWWSGQAFGLRPVGDATLLLTGHNHHLSVVEHGPRTHFQVPTTDSGSQWWDETKGLPSTPGLISLVVGADLNARGWNDLHIE